MRRGRFAPWLRVLAVSGPALAGAFGCVEDVHLGEFHAEQTIGGSGGSAGSTAVGGGGGGAEAIGGTLAIGGAPEGGSAGQAACVISYCLDRIYQCGDCLDNDSDGLVDADDSLCLGPCDNTEDSYYGGIPGQNNSPCRQDCYFDQDTGPGNDDCYWDHRCDELSLPDAYPPSGDSKCAYDANVSISGTVSTCADLEVEQSAACHDYCGPLTPNGCDCFGCCELPAGSGQYVWLGSTAAGVGSCSDSTLDDSGSCLPCTPVDSCLNTCDECELCVGRPQPADTCGGGTSTCGDYQACGQAGQAPCPAGTYCITGCCIAIPK